MRWPRPPRVHAYRIIRYNIYSNVSYLYKKYIRVCIVRTGTVSHEFGTFSTFRPRTGTISHITIIVHHAHRPRFQRKVQWKIASTLRTAPCIMMCTCSSVYVFVSLPYARTYGQLTPQGV